MQRDKANPHHEEEEAIGEEEGLEGAEEVGNRATEIVEDSKEND